MDNPANWFGEGGEVLAHAMDGDFAFLVVRHGDAGCAVGVFRLVEGHWRFMGGGGGDAVLWVNDRSGSDLGILGVGGFSSSETVRIVFAGEESLVAVLDGAFAWMRRDVPSRTYPEVVQR
jgi:hypothetical protein